MWDDGVKCVFVFFFKQKTAYEIVSRDWSSDVCSSDLPAVTVSLGLAASSAASVSQAAEGSTATPAAVTNTVSSSTP